MSVSLLADANHVDFLIGNRQMYKCVSLSLSLSLSYTSKREHTFLKISIDVYCTLEYAYLFEVNL